MVRFWPQKWSKMGLFDTWVRVWVWSFEPGYLCPTPDFGPGYPGPRPGSGLWTWTPCLYSEIKLFWPFFGKAKMRFRGSTFFKEKIVNKQLKNLNNFFNNKKNYIFSSQTHFCFYHFGSKMHCFRETAIWIRNFHLPYEFLFSDFVKTNHVWANMAGCLSSVKRKVAKTLQQN